MSVISLPGCRQTCRCAGITGAAVMSEEFDLDGRGAHLQDLELPEADAGPSKPLPHYVLFAPLSTVQGQVDWLLAAPYLQTFGLTAGAYVEHAKLATRVTLIGSGPDAPGAAVEQALAAAGCRVERIEGESEDIAAEHQRIQTGQPQRAQRRFSSQATSASNRSSST
ncbi:hypothetical protein [Candidatus Amarolinea dominans]|uniref:hypothetical protein n=1 Tax=Candidatus Amarolinea dominans TaxID=3140696 RepID=UPI003136ABC9|nr:hypothetical protein [Anaerolineae bacterium]